LIFWGNEDVLWYAILGVTLLAALLVRLGLSHFRREYLLGREIDTINFKWVGRTFRDRFRGQANTIQEWYRTELPISLRQLRQPLMIVIGLGLLAGIVSYLWVVVNVPAYIQLSPERIREFRTLIADNLSNVDLLQESLPAPVLFFHNARTTVIFLVLGLLSFGTLGLTLFIGNIALVGGVLGAAQLVGYSPLLAFAAGILPHGIFELSAIVLATAAMLKVGAQLVTPQPDKSLGETLLISLADWFRVFIGIVLPFLAIAALIEIYITPDLIKLAFPHL
jgi:stage II sporulation protein M